MHDTQAYGIDWGEPQPAYGGVRRAPFMAKGFRQEVINVALARVLQERGLVTAPEYILEAVSTRGRRMVDVIVDYNGLRTAIEGEVADQPEPQTRALESARRRVEEGVAHIGIAVVYPAHLRRVAFDNLPRELAEARLQMALVTEAEETGFVAGDVGSFETALQSAFERLVREDTVAKAVAILSAGVEQFASAFALRRGVTGRVIRALGIRALGSEQPPDEVPERPLPGEETPERGASRVSGLVVANAMIFQEILSGEDSRVLSLSQMPPDAEPIMAFIKHWGYVLGEIDYYPIFHVAREVLRALTAHREIIKAVQELADTARELVGMRAPMRHDLMGRVYHRLLCQAKYLGTYYTSIPAAALLLQIALRPEAWNVSWHELPKLRNFRAVDLACGTGTLLMAAAQALTQNYIEASQGKGPGLDLRELHRALNEDILYGYDVLPSAVHLTASTLALRAPEIAFRRMNMFSLPLGGKDRRLGSIEFLGNNKVNMLVDLFGPPSGTQPLDLAKAPEAAPAALPDMDLCVMNPPFTRSVGGNLLFGSCPPDERRHMQRKLGRMLRDPNVLASSTAGLGSVFVAVAHSHIKPGGRIAVVLPKAVLSGVAWGKTRQLLSSYYRVEYIICSHDPQRWNFSESTALSEVLLVAVKGRRGENPEKGRARVTAVNLWHNPDTPFEALAISRALRRDEAPDVESGQGALELPLGDQKLGEAVSVPWDFLKEQQSWLLPSAFAQSDLVRAAYHLLHGRTWLPGFGICGDIRLSKLGSFGDIGPDRRDIHDGFSVSASVTAYPAFWGHNAEEVLTIRQAPNAYLSPLGAAKKGRPLRKVEDLWPLSAAVMIPERLWLKTQRLAALRLTEPCLSNVWWPFRMKSGPREEAYEKVLALWFNSTLGLICLLCHRVETRGAWVGFKKPVLASMPVLDVQALSSASLKALAKDYELLADKPLGRFSEIGTDPIRAGIDGAVARALRLPDFSILRTLLAQEPIVSLKKL